jgi:hypothetical protein
MSVSVLLKSDCPLTSLIGEGRQIDIERLHADSKLFFRFAFPGFFQSADTEKRYIRNRRRYTGDLLSFWESKESDLPRGRYYALLTPHGHDGGLLREELLNYADANITSDFAILDGLQTGDFAKIGLHEPRDAIAAVILRTGDAIQKFDQFARQYNSDMVTRYLQSSSPILCALMNTIRTDLHIDRCFDLRYPTAREWLCETFRDGCPEITGTAEPFPGKDFLDMLPSLFQTSNGGGLLSQAVGVVLRRLGAEGLVFPSARKSVQATLYRGELVDWDGWNFVDYRGAPPALTPKELGAIFFNVRHGALPEKSDLITTVEQIQSLGQQPMAWGLWDSLWIPPDAARIRKIGRGRSPYEGSFSAPFDETPYRPAPSASQGTV